MTWIMTGIIEELYCESEEKEQRQQAHIALQRPERYTKHAYERMTLSLHLNVVEPTTL